MTQDGLETLLERGGHSLTPARKQVLGLLAGLPGSFTASEALAELAEVAPKVGRATLFRTLDLLIGLGALERVRLPGGQEGYVLCGPPHHHHVVCSSCGAVGEVDGGGFEDALSAAVQRAGFVLESHTIELSGVCAACSAGRGP